MIGEAQLSPKDVLAELHDGDGGKVRAVRAPGAMGVRPVVVLRDMAPEILGTPQLRSSAAQRILQATEISHPGWVRVFGALRLGDALGVAMELIAGCAIEDFEPRALAVETVEHVAAKVAGVLESLHRGRDALGRPRRRVHGSVTPDKVMLSLAGDVKLLDFAVTATTPRALAGPEAWPAEWAPWIPPELPLAGAPTPASDLYMLGATVYFMLTGRAPYRAGASFDLSAWRALPPPSRLRPEVRPSLDALVMSMLAPDPGARPGSAQEVAETLDARPSRAALSAVVRDAVPDRVPWLEELKTPGPRLPPLVLASADSSPALRIRAAADDDDGPAANDADAIPDAPSRGPVVVPRIRPLRPEAAPEPVPVPAPEPRQMVPRPPHALVSRVGEDSVELFRVSAQRLFGAADSSAPQRFEPMLTPPAAPSASAPAAATSPSSIEPAPARPSWRRPIGLLMILGAALVSTALTSAHPEHGRLDLRPEPADAVVRVVGHPDLGARAELPPGVYKVQVRAPGFVEQQIATEIGPGEHRVVLVQLDPEPLPVAEDE